MKIKILIPIYNDWKSVDKLISEIDIKIKDLNHEFSIIIIDDGSTEVKSDQFENLENLKSLKIIHMKYNIGHQRCIATGLKYINENEEFDYIIPMDGDGEDRPEEIKLFIDNIDYHSGAPIAGERVKRSEGIFFRIGYFFHKFLTLFFTGKSIKYGNFTLLPKSTVEKLIRDKSTWSSFSGALSKVEKEIPSTPSERGKRYFGPSQMNYKKLIVHSLSIIAVFKPSVIIRSIAFYAIYLILISNNLSIITCIPLGLIIIFVLIILKVSGRESLENLNKSLENINKVDIIK